MIDYLTVDDLLEVARRVVGIGTGLASGNDANNANGRPSNVQIRDPGLLASAAARPKMTVFGQDAYPGIWEKAAALMESLGRNHTLIDGNKRLAWNATWLFLGLNGHPLREPLDDDAAERFVIDVVTGKLELQQIATGLLSFAE